MKKIKDLVCTPVFHSFIEFDKPTCAAAPEQGTVIQFTNELGEEEQGEFICETNGVWKLKKL